MLASLLAEKKNKNHRQQASLQMYISACTRQQSAQIKAELDALQVVVLDGWQVAGGVKLSLAVANQGVDSKAINQHFFTTAEQLSVDIVCVDMQPIPNLNQAGILFMDMDSTLIQCECIDEIADFLGIKSQISGITQQAMEGKLDFSESLIARVKLLAGLDASVLTRVYDERIRLTDGAEELIQTVQQAGWKVGLVSGGFTFFTDLLQARLNLDFTRANQLEIQGGKLTGRVLGDIVDANMKRSLLLSQSKVWGIDMAQTMALGDGANDLPMLQAAGLGIAFHAKPKVRELAPYVLRCGGLNQALHLLTNKDNQQ